MDSIPKPTDDLKEVENIPEKAMTENQYMAGITTDYALNRLLFRLNHIEKAIEKKKLVLREGNIASLEREIHDHLTLMQDLLDVNRELAAMAHVSVNQIINGVEGIFSAGTRGSPPSERSGVSG